MFFFSNTKFNLNGKGVIHGMPNISAKELSALEDLLAYEQVAVKKYRTIASTTADPIIKGKCEQIAGKHQEHYNKLLTFLN